MVTESLKKHFEAKGVQVIPQDVGAQILVQECSPSLDKKCQVVIGSSMVTAPPQKPELQRHFIRKTIELAKNAWVQDHAIGGTPVLPMVHALSWMIEGALGLYPGWKLAEALDVSVLKGLMLHEPLPPFDLFVSEVEKSEMRILLEAKIQSEKDGKTIFHYSTKIVLSLTKQKTPTIELLNADMSEEGSSFYQNKVLFHGPGLQMVQELQHFDDHALLLRCKCPKPESKGQFGYHSFNPFTEDGLLQAMLIQAFKMTGLPSLPLKIAKVEAFHPTPLGREFYITLKVEEASPNRLKATIVSHSKSGQVYARFQGAEVTISEKLKEKF